MEAILLNLLARSMSEFSQINADLAIAKQNLQATVATADEITGAIREREVGHREWSAYTPENGRE